jgi:hypothetical protein
VVRRYEPAAGTATAASGTVSFRYATAITDFLKLLPPKVTLKGSRCENREHGKSGKWVLRWTVP